MDQGFSQPLFFLFLFFSLYFFPLPSLFRIEKFAGISFPATLAREYVSDGTDQPSLIATYLLPGARVHLDHFTPLLLSLGFLLLLLLFLLLFLLPSYTWDSTLGTILFYYTLPTGASPSTVVSFESTKEKIYI